MWLVLVTMTTIGYGDSYPKTHMGRFLGIIVCFWGVFIVSFFVVTINNMLVFSPNEERSFFLLMRLYYKQGLKAKAAAVLQSVFQQKNIRLHEPENHSKLLASFRHFRKNMLEFKRVALTVRGFNEGDTDIEIMGKRIE